MLTLKTLRSWMIKLAGGLVAVTLGAGLALAPAYAAASPDTGTPPSPLNQGLQSIYQREQTWLSAQSNSLTDANTAAVNAQNWINTLKGQGKDTTPLENALTTFNGQVAAAQTAHNVAAGVLTTHAGFDANGLVTDRAQAVGTLRQAYRPLQQAHLTLVGATVNLRLAVRLWINAHK